MSAHIKYKRGYKYQLSAPYMHYTGIKNLHVENRFLRLYPSGLLIIRTGYAWDGASGPGLDTPNILRGSLVHDALYQLIQEGLLPLECKQIADTLLYKICREDGMSWIRAQWVYRAVDIFGGSYAANNREVLFAP